MLVYYTKYFSYLGAYNNRKLELKAQNKIDKLSLKRDDRANLGEYHEAAGHGLQARLNYRLADKNQRKIDLVNKKLALRKQINNPDENESN